MHHNNQMMKSYRKQWWRENPEKLKEYRENRLIHKSHDITKEEWGNCLEYFNYSCAYCGLSEEKSLDKYSERLHKDHVDNNGSNGIENAVPACKSCNSSKSTKSFLVWYKKRKKIFSQERLNKILEWLDIQNENMLNVDD